MKTILCSIVVLLMCPSIGPAQMSLGKESLKGLGSVRVLIEDLNPDLVKVGIDKDRLQQDVELRLRRSGIKVVSPAAASPYLYIIIASTRIGNTPTVAFSIHVTLRQRVSLERNLSIKMFADTWRGSIVIAANSNLTQIRDTLADAVDTFINDYLAENVR